MSKKILIKNISERIQRLREVVAEQGLSHQEFLQIISNSMCRVFNKSKSKIILSHENILKSIQQFCRKKGEEELLFSLLEELEGQISSFEEKEQSLQEQKEGILDKEAEKKVEPQESAQKDEVKEDEATALFEKKLKMIREAQERKRERRAGRLHFGEMYQPLNLGDF